MNFCHTFSFFNKFNQTSPSQPLSFQNVLSVTEVFCGWSISWNPSFIKLTLSRTHLKIIHWLKATARAGPYRLATSVTVKATCTTDVTTDVGMYLLQLPDYVVLLSSILDPLYLSIHPPPSYLTKLLIFASKAETIMTCPLPPRINFLKNQPV